MPLSESDTGPGKAILIDTGVDLSANTEIEIVFTLPDGTESIKARTAGQVVLGTTQKIVQTLGTLPPNTWVEYYPEAGFAVAGEYCGYLRYTNTVTGDIWIGDPFKFTVKSIKCA